MRLRLGSLRRSPRLPSRLRRVSSLPILHLPEAYGVWIDGSVGSTTQLPVGNVVVARCCRLSYAFTSAALSSSFHCCWQQPTTRDKKCKLLSISVSVSLFASLFVMFQLLQQAGHIGGWLLLEYCSQYIALIRCQGIVRVITSKFAHGVFIVKKKFPSFYLGNSAF